jgi:glucose-6-phosphate isomerase
MKGLASELAEVHSTLDAMLAYAEQVRGDAAITDVVNIGIGGSDLGPQMAVLALDSFVSPGKRFHFVSNVDGHELAALLPKLKPASTLFLIASKTFTTTETMMNARSAKAWFEANGGKDTARHFAALTTNVSAAKDFGIATTFGFLGLGGRPLFHVVGHRPAAGHRHRRRGLPPVPGRRACDGRTLPHRAVAQNLPVRLGLLDVWYRNFHKFTSRSIAPYHSALRRLPAYLQQLEMESNGKQVDLAGRPLPYGTSPCCGASPAPTASMPTSRCCTRAPTPCRSNSSR